MDRAVVSGMVEDYYRTLIPAMQTNGIAGFEQTSQHFEQRVRQTADLLPPVEAAAFLQQVEAERERLMTEYRADPISLKRRLNISMGADCLSSREPRSGNNLGGLAVRTVVRATIWQSIREIFRVLR